MDKQKPASVSVVDIYDVNFKTPVTYDITKYFLNKKKEREINLEWSPIAALKWSYDYLISAPTNNSNATVALFSRL